MTWTKFGAEFRDECAEAGLSDAAFRTHVEAIMYLYGVEHMDMKIRRHLVRRWAGSDRYQDAVGELVAKGYWESEADDWRVVHHEDVFRQSLAAQKKKREAEKNRQRSKRASASGVGTNTDANVGATQSVSQSYSQELDNSDENRDEAEQHDDALIDSKTGEVLGFTPLGSKPPKPTPVDPWATPSPRTMCGQCGDWVGRDREVNGQTLCAPCVRGERRAS